MHMISITIKQCLTNIEKDREDLYFTQISDCFQVSLGSEWKGTRYYSASSAMLFAFM
jgi:hypothetical protein